MLPRERWHIRHDASLYETGSRSWGRPKSLERGYVCAHKPQHRIRGQPGTVLRDTSANATGGETAPTSSCQKVSIVIDSISGAVSTKCAGSDVPILFFNIHTTRRNPLRNWHGLAQAPRESTGQQARHNRSSPKQSSWRYPGAKRQRRGEQRHGAGA